MKIIRTNKVVQYNYHFLPLIVLFLSSLVKNVSAVYCYECDSSVDMTCGESLAEGHTIEPSDCLHLQEPLFCVKMTGLYEALCLMCYQCDSSIDDICPERFTPRMVDAGLKDNFEAKSCHGIYRARYCIKTTGLFKGELGTKRFCSARDFGNYCEMARRPGDERLYRACVYTCQSHYCNLSSPKQVSIATLLLGAFSTFFTYWRH